MTAASLVILALVSGCASSDSRLIGRWHSNRSLSLVTFPHRKQLPSAKRAFFDGIFGRLTLSYTRRYIFSELPPKGTEEPFRQRIPYRVLTSDSDSVTINSKDISSGSETTTPIHFVGPNRYWIPLGTKGGREYFDRLNQ